MKKYILVLVIVLGLFISFGKVYAFGEVDICWDERKEIVAKGWESFLPEGKTVESIKGNLYESTWTSQAKADYDAALKDKSKECNKLEQKWIDKTKPVCDTTASDKTISSLKDQVSTLETKNNSLTLQVSTLQQQLITAQVAQKVKEKNLVAAPVVEKPIIQEDVKTESVPVVDTTEKTPEPHEGFLTRFFHWIF